MRDYPVQLTRRVSFSSGHRYWSNGLDIVKNREIYGPLASPYNHGHNYVLEVTIRGFIDPEDGMVINIKRLDDLLKTRVLGLFDGKSINDEVPPFDQVPPTLENLLQCIWNLIAGKPIRFANRYAKSWRWDADMLLGLAPELSLPDEVRITNIRLEEMPTLFSEIISTPYKNYMTLSRTYEFAASHRLHVPSMSDQMNLELFGKCNNPAGHGHNYILEVTVEGIPDPVSGMILRLEEMDRIVNSLVVDRYDHKNLNVDIPEIKGSVATSEVVAQAIFESLDDKLPAKLHRIRLHETARNCFEVLASD